MCYGDVYLPNTRWVVRLKDLLIHIGSRVMPAESVKQVLDDVKLFYQRLGEFCQQQAGEVEDERVKMLLEYLSEQETLLETGLASYESLADSSVLNFWFQYGGSEALLKKLDTLTLDSKRSIDDVIALAMDLSRGVTGFCRFLAENAESPQVADLFNNLVSLEEHKQRKLSVATDRLMEL